jgi:hypothetical protein
MPLKNKQQDSILREKAKASKIPKPILEQVYRRGAAAWATGHRPGASREAWALARVNSFITKGKTYSTADADLAKKARKRKAKK